MRLPRVRLSVRSMMVLVLVVGGPIGWVVGRAHLQRDAVAAIERSGGSVAYDWQWSGDMTVPGRPQPPGPAWVRRTLGPHFLDTVTSVHLKGPRCGDEALRAACRLPWLEELSVVNTGVTDAGAEDLGRLRRLRSLDFRLNRATPRPLRHIGRMGGLRELKLAMRLSPVPLKDGDMAFLSRLTGLRRLMLPSADLTDEWLAYVGGLNDLESLELYDMRVTTDGLRHLRGLSKLRVLSLHGTRVRSLEPLGPLRDLNSLCIAYTPVEDADLAALRGRPGLVRLDLRRTRVTDEGVEGLLRANPGLKVTR